MLAKGRLDEAIAECQVSLRLKNSAQAHVNLGNVLDYKGQRDGAIAEYRKAIEVNKDYAPAHYNLGVFLENNGRLDEAGKEYREAIRLRKDFAKAHCGLANVLMMQGSLREAVNEYRRGHELGSLAPGWSFPSAETLHRAESMARLDARLPDLLAGRARPKDTAEQMTLAWLCQQSYKRLYAASARWYVAAFAAQPSMAEDLQMRHRYNAACAAALAGCGKGKDADTLSSGDRARLRQQARDWLRADLKAYEQVFDQPEHRLGSVLALYLQQWLKDDDLASVRNEVALAKLPEAERARWRKLWADAAGLLAKTRGDRSAGAPPVKR